MTDKDPIQKKIDELDPEKRAKLQAMADEEGVTLYEFLTDLADFKDEVEGKSGSRVIVVKNSSTGDIIQSG